MGESKPQAEKMTVSKVDFSFRIYWTKLTRNWTVDQRATARQRVQQITQAAEFNANLIEKRYTVILDGIPENTHSGMSLLALLDVLDALDALEESDNS